MTMETTHETIEIRRRSNGQLILMSGMTLRAALLQTVQNYGAGDLDTVDHERAYGHTVILDTPERAETAEWAAVPGMTLD